MKYLSAVTGAALLIYLFSRETVRVFGISCRVISVDSTGYGGDPVCMSDGAFTVGIVLGLAMLLVGGALIAKDFLADSGVTSASYSSAQPRYSFSGPSGDENVDSSSSIAPTKAAEQAPRFDKKKWQVLKGVDADIAAASAEVSAMSPELDDILAERYLVLNDKAYLAALVSTIKKENTERIEAERSAKEAAQAAMSEKQRAQMETRKERSLATIENIKKAGMYNTLNRKKVVSAEMYYGDKPEYHGYAKVIYEDGTAEMRSGESWGYCDPKIS